MLLTLSISKYNRGKLHSKISPAEQLFLQLHAGQLDIVLFEIGQDLFL